MLTDYHTHLRPDALDATPEAFFTEGNVARYLEAAAGHGIGDLGFSEHVYRFREALEIWTHPFWQENATDDLDGYCEFVERMKAAGHPVKRGTCAPYPGARGGLLHRVETPSGSARIQAMPPHPDRWRGATSALGSR